MMTRRTILSAGLVFTATACTTAFGAADPTESRRREARAIDALLIDETIEIPEEISELVEASRRRLPVVGIQLDAASHAELMSVLQQSQVIVGVSSGATLFCLERMAREHGLRLTERHQRCASDSVGNPCWRDVANLLSMAHPLAVNPSPNVGAYRPSRMDGMLHVWTMQRYADPQFNHGRQEL
jgi:hypothetical protein